MIERCLPYSRFLAKRAVHNKSGEISPKPDRGPFAFWGIAMCLPGIIIGAYTAKYVAKFLEDCDIYSYSDDLDFDD